MIPFVLVGASGRMGRAILDAARVTGGFEVRALVSRHDPGGEHGARWVESVRRAVQPGVVVLEFSSPEIAVETAHACAATGSPLVSGTTGLGPADEEAFETAAERVAVVRAANFSPGLLALRQALDAALASLPGWDVEIVERHHRLKSDSPSGTALALARQAAAARGWDDRAFRHGRSGRPGPRTFEEIGLHAVRGGTLVGDHAVILAGGGESLELRHTVQDRSAFAYGALRAAKFVARAAPGLYTFDAVPASSGEG